MPSCRSPPHEVTEGVDEAPGREVVVGVVDESLVPAKMLMLVTVQWLLVLMVLPRVQIDQARVKVVVEVVVAAAVVTLTICVLIHQRTKGRPGSLTSLT